MGESFRWIARIKIGDCFRTDLSQPFAHFVGTVDDFNPLIDGNSVVGRRWIRPRFGQENYREPREYCDHDYIEPFFPVTPRFG